MTTVDSCPKTLLFRTHTACYAKSKYSLIGMYYYVPNWLYTVSILVTHNAYSRRYIFLRPVVAPYTEISGTLFWSNFFMLHRQNTLYNAQGLSKKCMIYVRVHRKHWKSKRQHFYLWVKNINVSKITHCPCMSLCSMPIALWHLFWNPKLFSNLHSAEYEQLNWRKTGR